MKYLILFLFSCMYFTHLFAEDKSGLVLTIGDETFIFDSKEKLNEFHKKFKSQNCLKQDTTQENCECQSILLDARLEAIALSNSSDKKIIDEYKKYFKKYKKWVDVANTIEGRLIAGEKCNQFNSYSDKDCKKKKWSGKNLRSSCGCMVYHTKSNLNFSLKKLNNYLKEIKLKTSSNLHLPTILRQSVGLVNVCNEDVEKSDRKISVCLKPEESKDKKMSEDPVQSISLEDHLKSKLKDNYKEIRKLSYIEAACSTNRTIQQQFQEYLFSKLSNQDNSTFDGTHLDTTFDFLDIDQKWCLMNKEAFIAYKPERISQSASSYLYACARSKYSRPYLCNETPVNKEFENYAKINCNKDSFSDVLPPPYNLLGASSFPKYKLSPKDKSACSNYFDKCKELLIGNNERLFEQHLKSIESLYTFKIGDKFAYDACKGKDIAMNSMLKENAWKEAMGSDIMEITSAFSTKAISYGIRYNPNLKEVPFELKASIAEWLLKKAKGFRWEMIKESIKEQENIVDNDGNIKSKDDIRKGVKRLYENSVNDVVKSLKKEVIFSICSSDALVEYYKIKDRSKCSTTVEKNPLIINLSEFVKQGLNRSLRKPDFQL